jgi:hypothetical protein
VAASGEEHGLFAVAEDSYRDSEAKYPAVCSQGGF